VLVIIHTEEKRKEIYTQKTNKITGENGKCLTLVDFQLDAQNSYLFTYNTFIKILYVSSITLLIFRRST